MGGVAKAVVKPVQQAGKSIAKAAGLTDSRPAPAAPAPSAEAPQPAGKQAAQMAAEDRSARRRARRGGRALLSEARLNPEQGVSTLGQAGMI